MPPTTPETPPPTPPKRRRPTAEQVKKTRKDAEKATQELEAPASGVLTEILVQAGEDAKVRTLLAYIETDG